MKVKAIQNHSNVFGEQFHKASGESYDLPDAHAAALIESGVVEAEGPAKTDANPKK